METAASTTITNGTATSRTLATATPWLTVHEAAERARCGVKTIYREVRAGRLKAAKVGGRRELRFLTDWVDAWLVAATTTGAAIGATR